MKHIGEEVGGEKDRMSLKHCRDQWPGMPLSVSGQTARYTLMPSYMYS